jgi:hypothetical protein
LPGFKAWQLHVVKQKVFSPALAFGASQFFVSFYNISFSVTDRTNHLPLLGHSWPMQAARIQMPFFMFTVRTRKTAIHHQTDATPPDRMPSPMCTDES